MKSAISDENTAGYVSISDEEAAREVVKKVIGGLWEAVNELTRLRPRLSWCRVVLARWGIGKTNAIFT